MTIRYTILLDRDEADDLAYGDGSEAGQIAQVAKELQEAMDDSGLPVGMFQIVKREEVA